MRLAKVIGIGLVLGILSAGGVMGCASEPKLPVASMPAGQSFSGLWYTNFGDMKLTQRADGSVHGTFDYKSGGVIDGTVEGGVMKFSWSQPGDFQVGRREVNGHGYLVLTNGEDGAECSGEWGYSEHYTGGGKWTGRKATEIYIK